jgi:multidrug resistance efflux pump
MTTVNSPAPKPEDNRLRQQVELLRLPANHVNRSSWARTAAWLFLLVLFLAGGSAFYWNRDWFLAKEEPAGPPPKAPSPKNEIVLESKGYVVPVHRIQVGPKINGMITKLHVMEGMRVKKDDVLAELEDIDYKAERDRATAMLDSAKKRLEELERGFRPQEKEQAKAELAEADAQKDQLELEFKRTEALREKNVRTVEEYEITQSKLLAMRQRVEKLRNAVELILEGPRIEKIEVARAEVALAKADLAKAQWRLENCTIRAPISGTILTKNAEEGNIVNPIAFQGSFSLCDMADLSDLEIDLSIQERDIAGIFKGQTCKVRTEAYPNKIYNGRVSRLMPIADRAKGAIPVRVKVDVPTEEEGVFLKPEMGAIVSFYASELDKP